MVQRNTPAELAQYYRVWYLINSVGMVFFFFVFFWRTRVHFRNFHLCCPLQRSAHSQVPSEVATHQEIGSQLWAGETPYSNPGLQDNSLARYHWATTPPHWATTPPKPPIIELPHLGMVTFYLKQWNFICWVPKDPMPPESSCSTNSKGATLAKNQSIFNSGTHQLSWLDASACRLL